jgi:pterin-4a-carbinolamine dehydratase
LMVFTLIQAASKKWLRLKGRNQLPKVIEGTKFNDGVEATDDAKTAPPDEAHHPNSSIARHLIQSRKLRVEHCAGFLQLLHFLLNNS